MGRSNHLISANLTVLNQQSLRMTDRWLGAMCFFRINVALELIRKVYIVLQRWLEFGYCFAVKFNLTEASDAKINCLIVLPNIVLYIRNVFLGICVIPKLYSFQESICTLVIHQIKRFVCCVYKYIIRYFEIQTYYFTVKRKQRALVVCN